MGGAQKTLESVNKASDTLDVLQQHAQKVEQHPAIPKVAPKDPAVTAAESARQAEGAVKELGKQGEKVAAFVSDPAVAELVERREAALKKLEKMEGEAEYRNASAVKRPGKVFKDAAEVKEYSDKLDGEKKERQRKMDEQLVEEAAAKGNISEARKNLTIFGMRARNFFTDLAESLSFGDKIRESRKNRVFAERNERIHQEVVGGMEDKRKYMGEEGYAAYREAPTVMATINLPGDLKSGELGVFFRNTNSIAVDSEVKEEAQARCVIRHEEYHRASEIAGGRAIRWRGDDGKAVVPTDLQMLKTHEGLTEFLAQQDERALGREAAAVYYPREVVLACYIQEVVGREPLEKAYFSGDFTEVRRIMDGKLGAGSFEKVFAITDAKEAANFLVMLAEAKGMDTAQWDKNTIVERAKSSPAYKYD